MSKQSKFSKIFRRTREKSLIAPPCTGELRVVVAFPNEYSVAMSSLGFQTIYRVLAANKECRVERAFVDQEKSSKSRIRTLESSALLSQAHLLAVSVSFELDYLNILTLLESAGCHLPDQRFTITGEALDDGNNVLGRPLLIAGGAAVTLNPEPLVGFFDALMIGEGDEAINEIVQVLNKYRHSFQNDTEARNKLLSELSQIKGVYVPSLYQVAYHPDGGLKGYRSLGGAPTRVKRRIVEDLDQCPTHSAIITEDTQFSSMLLVETGRGCPMGCRFCAAGYMSSPYRRRSQEAIRQSIEQGIGSCSSIGLLGAAVSAHPNIVELTSYGAAQGLRVSLSSLISSAVSTELAEAVSKSSGISLALAPETGGEELRKQMGKRVTNQQIIKAAETLAANGIRQLKLYFMIGLPGETLKDVELIGELCKDIADAVALSYRGEKGKTLPWMQLSVNAFIPKAWTPLQREPMLNVNSLKERFKLLKESCKMLPRLRIVAESPRSSYFQTVLSRGDRRVGNLLLWLKKNNKNYLSLAACGEGKLLNSVPPLDHFAYCRFKVDELLPWEMIDFDVG